MSRVAAVGLPDTRMRYSSAAHADARECRHFDTLPGARRWSFHWEDPHHHLRGRCRHQARHQSEKTGKGYQTLINEALKSQVDLGEQPVTQELVRTIVREELAASS